MLFLTATKETQGKRKNDFNHATEGEPVMFAFECDSETVDGSCGCKRSMSGLESMKATTTMKVAEVDTDVRKLQILFLTENLKMDMKKATKIANEDAREINRIATFFGAGTIVEKRGRNFRERKK